jgi:Ca-activated chloride channel homolog
MPSVYLCSARLARALLLSPKEQVVFELTRGPSQLPYRKLLALLAAASFISPLAMAQQEKTAPAAQRPLEAKTELVKLDVTVLNQRGDFVDGLEQKSFRVLDAGVERPITFFAPVSAPADVVILLETSPAVYLFQDEHIAAAYALLGGLGADDQVALVTYSDVPRSVVSFTTNKSQLLNALGNIQYTVGMASLNLYDSISAVIDGISPFPGKKALVLLTTGLDSSAPDRWGALTQKLQRADVVIFSIGLGQALGNNAATRTKGPQKPSPVSSSTNDSPILDKARDALVSLSAMTGGRAYFPGTDQDFAPAYREIAASLRHEYVLGIDPQHDGKFHALSVEVLNENGSVPKKKHGQAEYRVSARQGYMAPGP